MPGHGLSVPQLLSGACGHPSRVGPWNPSPAGLSGVSGFVHTRGDYWPVVTAIPGQMCGLYNQKRIWDSGGPFAGGETKALQEVGARTGPAPQHLDTQAAPQAQRLGVTHFIPG